MREEAVKLSYDKKISFDKAFWLFIMAGIVGIILEGVTCLILKKHWETHVTTSLFPLNCLYGIGAVLFYAIAKKLQHWNLLAKAFLIMIIATVLELLVGLLINDGLGVRAWDYTNEFLNFRGMICLVFSIGWGIAGLVFCLIYKYVDRFLEIFTSKGWHIAAMILVVLIAIDLLFTAVSITNWSHRHYGEPVDTSIERFFESVNPDDHMQSRFIEWEFLDDVQTRR